MKNRILNFTALMLVLMMSVAGFSQNDSTKEIKTYEGKRIKVVINEKVVLDDSISGSEIKVLEDELKVELAGLKTELEEVEKEIIECTKDDEPKIMENSFMVMDIGFNAWMQNNELGLPDAFNNMALDRARSINFHLGAIQQGINIAQGKVRFVYGLGIEYNNYRFNNNIDIEKGSTPLNVTENDARDYRKNKLVSQYLTAPVMLHLNTNPKRESRNFHLGIGAQFGYLIRSAQKQKWGSGRDKNKQKVVGDFQLSEQRLGYVVQVGYGGHNLYAKYYPTSAFKKNQGPDVQTVAVGFILSPF